MLSKFDTAVLTRLLDQFPAPYLSPLYFPLFELGHDRIAVRNRALEAAVLVRKAVNRSAIKFAIWKPN